MPPEVLFVHRCVDVNIHPEFKKQAKKCVWATNTAQSSNDGVECLPCSGDVKFPSKPDSCRAECNWACGCPSHCAHRQLQRGVSHRLQVMIGGSGSPRVMGGSGGGLKQREGSHGAGRLHIMYTRKGDGDGGGDRQ